MQSLLYMSSTKCSDAKREKRSTCIWSEALFFLQKNLVGPKPRELFVAFVTSQTQMHPMKSQAQGSVADRPPLLVHEDAHLTLLVLPERLLLAPCLGRCSF